MANLRRRIPQQTESLFTENHEPFFNSIGQSRHLNSALGVSAIAPIATKMVYAICVAKGHVWTAPAVQEESDFSAKRSGAAMYTACFRVEACPRRDAAAMAAGPDVIR